MFFKNIKYAFRNLGRDKFYTFLNGVGLTIGMTVALLIFMWIQDEMSYDNYHSKNGSNYFVLANTFFMSEPSWGVRTPAPLGPAIKEKIPEVQHVARVYGLWKAILKHENFIVGVDDSYLVEPSLLKILDFEFLHGDPETALDNPNSIVLTDKVASKIFGSENPIGKTIQLDELENLVITAVIKSTSKKTHLPVDCFIPLEKNIYSYNYDKNMHWRNYSFSTYLTLRPGVDAQQVGKALTGLIPPWKDEPEDKKPYLELHPVKDIYLGLSKVEYSFAQGDWNTIRLFGLIAMIILLIASINYINLTTARAAHRAKATGIKKIVGASRPHLIGQHMTEALCLIFLCSLTAFSLAYFGLPYFEKIAGTELTTETIFSKNTFFILSAITLITVLLSSIQPAFQLTALRPMEILKGSRFNDGAKKNGLRKVLVIAQFVSSAALIICTIFMLRQMNYIQATKLGYDKEHIFKFSHNNENTKPLLNSLRDHPSITEVAKSDQSIVSITNSYGGLSWDGVEGEQDLQFFNMYSGPNVKDFFNLELVNGRWFDPELKSDSNTVIINETAAQMMQLENPVGKYMNFWGEKTKIIGLSKDFHFQSLHTDIKPLLFMQNADWFPTVYVKTTGKNTADAIAATEQIFKQHLPNEIFKYEFLDETFNQLLSLIHI